MGAVTTPETAPESARPTAVSIDLMIIGAAALDGWPETTWPFIGTCRTGRASRKAARPPAEVITRRTIEAPAAEAEVSALMSPTATKAGPLAFSACQALTA